MMFVWINKEDEISLNKRCAHYFNFFFLYVVRCVCTDITDSPVFSKKYRASISRRPCGFSSTFMKTDCVQKNKHTYQCVYSIFHDLSLSVHMLFRYKTPLKCPWVSFWSVYSNYVIYKDVYMILSSNWNWYIKQNFKTLSVSRVKYI